MLLPSTYQTLSPRLSPSKLHVCSPLSLPLSSATKRSNFKLSLPSNFLRVLEPNCTYIVAFHPMSSCRGRRSKSNSRRGVISELPANVKERILELLPTRDAARTALLSTHWRDVWLEHGRFVFDGELLVQCNIDKKKAALVNLINDCLLRHPGSVKRFTLCFHNWSLQPQQSDLDRWFLFLLRNGVEELNISILIFLFG